MNTSSGCLQERLQEKISLTEKVLAQWFEIRHVRGAEKLKRKILAELKFLRKIESSNILKEDHLLSSNLSHLHAILDVARGEGPGGSKDLVSILEPFQYRSTSPTEGTKEGRLVVDIVAGGGTIWIKVVARNPKALHFISTGQGQYGERTIIDQAQDFVQCSKQHTFHFVPPRIRFVFQSGVTTLLASKLQNLGVEVEGELLETRPETPDQGAEPESLSTETDSEDSTDYSDDEEIDLCTTDSSQQCTLSSEYHNPAVTRLNLDITALIAYVSALTNGHCHLRFKEPILTQQAEWERKSPVKPQIDALFEGRELLCCKTAIDDFQTILNILGGDGERERAEEFLKRVTIVSDQPSQRSLSLDLKGGIKERSRIIFGTGDTIKAVTVTANSGFVRSAQSQGVSFAVIIHESRALTEGKQKDAQPLQED